MMKNCTLPVLLLLVLAVSCPLFGQTAAKLEALLETPVLTWGEASAFVQEASPAGPSPGADKQWLPKGASPGDTARLNGIALLLMRSFDIKGGLFYRIGRSPHHAYRELEYKKVIRGTMDPDMPVSGADLLFMVNRLLAMTEEAEGVSK